MSVIAELQQLLGEAKTGFRPPQLEDRLSSIIEHLSEHGLLQLLQVHHGYVITAMPKGARVQMMFQRLPKPRVTPYVVIRLLVPNTSTLGKTFKEHYEQQAKPAKTGREENGARAQVGGSQSGRGVQQHARRTKPKKVEAAGRAQRAKDGPDHAEVPRPAKRKKVRR